MLPINTIFQRSRKWRTLKPQVEASRVIDLFSQVKDGYFEPALARQMMPVKAYKDAIQVACMSEQAAAAIKNAERPLLSILNKELGKTNIIRIDCLT